jgi:hypothetical protein
MGDTGHLNDDDLHRFSLFGMDPGEAATAYDHLRGCPHCNARYVRMMRGVTDAVPAPEIVKLDDPNV